MSAVTVSPGAPTPEAATSEDDRALWSRLVAGDDAALTELYRRHCDAVHNFAFRRTASWAAAEDVVQATFTALLRRARSGSVDPLRAETARPVLLVMAGQECANVARWARRQRLLRGRIETDSGGAVSPDHAGSTATRVDDERRMSEVRRALALIPAVQREVIELVVWSHCSVAEAAGALGVPEGTVKSRLHRARRSLTSVIEIDALKEALT
ncbi:sigma-70 family RNA polymerase sigma factor [Terrabacter aerolatus]|uniref:Siderophore-interacting protein n=1 Tax=Terrabacter aerolatus TaxID=422442 RepID=A0A512D6H6_9MICO|nr:sigma-70 family RNA polymerase sigma factor [Terrabacter aerolatus]GEO32081.1 siderophore-interacting protein [Terrabacter aerolatus]